MQHFKIIFQASLGVNDCEDHSSLYVILALRPSFISTSVGFSSELVLCFSLFQPTESEDALFLPQYYYGFTAFRSQAFDSLYLGCDNNKSGATLVEMDDVNYPNPQALFTVNIINLDVEDNQSFGP